MKKYKAIKVIKSIVSLTVAYIIAGIILSLALSLLDRPIAIFMLNVDSNVCLGLSIAYLLIFIILYQFVYKKTKRFHTFLRIILYAIFASFSATFLIFLLFDSVLQYSHFLRYKSSISYSIDSVSPAIYPVFLVGFIGYVILTTFIEAMNKVNNFIKPLAYWFFTVLIGWYILIPILVLRTGWKYQNECTGWGFANKSIRAQEYCYTIGEPIYYNWTLVPTFIIAAFEVFFISWYFLKNKKTKHHKS